MIDLMAIASIDRDTELSYVRRERDWLERAQAGGRDIPHERLLPMLPPGLAGNGATGKNGSNGASDAAGAAGGSRAIHHK